MRFNFGTPLHLSALPTYEDTLLSSLAFFRQQPRETQALNCLAMYLRQSEARVLGEVKFYAQMLDLEPEELLLLIHINPGQVEARLGDALKSRLDMSQDTPQLGKNLCSAQATQTQAIAPDSDLDKSLEP